MIFILRDYQSSLVNEVHNAWREGFKRPCIVLPCGGGKSIITADMAKRTTDNHKNVLSLVHRQELCEQIEQTFRSYGVDMNFCNVGMVQTITRSLDKIPEPSLVITDENHHCLAASYRRIYERFPKAYCVGVTATPVRLNGGGLGDVNDKLIVGVSAKWLIKNHYLAPYDYYAPQVADLSGIRSRGGDYSAEDAAAALDRPKVYGDVVKYYKQLSGGKAICYCSTIDHSRATCKAFNDAGITSYHIDGKTPQSERERAIQAFRNGDIKILCNVDLISEGFDVPDCECAILLRPTKSLTLFIQQSMRCMRYQPGKKAVIIDHVGNVHRHGLPDTDREWTLDPKPQRSKVNTVSVRQCTHCFFTHEPSPICPNCGYVYPKKPRELKEEKETRLTKIVEAYTSPKECGNASELFAYAKKIGRKPGWAYHEARRRGYLH